MSRKYIMLGICIGLHALVLINVWHVSKMTPREIIIAVSACYL